MNVLKGLNRLLINSWSRNQCQGLSQAGQIQKDQACPRPLLLKLNCAIDVISVLSNRDSLQDKSIVTKPDISLKKTRQNLYY